MNKTKVINLGRVRDLLAEWDRVRDHIRNGEIAGFQTLFCDDEGREAMYQGGLYKEDPNMALRATLKLSAARMLAEESEPRLVAGKQ